MYGRGTLPGGGSELSGDRVVSACRPVLFRLPSVLPLGMFLKSELKLGLRYWTRRGLALL